MDDTHTRARTHTHARTRTHLLRAPCVWLRPCNKPLRALRAPFASTRLHSPPPLFAVCIISNGTHISTNPKNPNPNPPWRGIRGKAQRLLWEATAAKRARDAAAAAKAAGTPLDTSPDPLLMASEGLKRVTVLSPLKANVLDLIKHNVLVVSTGALEELHTRFQQEQWTGHISDLGETPPMIDLAPPEPEPMPVPEQPPSQQQAEATA